MNPGRACRACTCIVIRFRSARGTLWLILCHGATTTWLEMLVVVCNRHTLGRSVDRRARARVYIGIFVAVYHFSACPPFTPHHGLFKVSRRRRRARACARGPADVGQQAVTGLAPAVLPNRRHVCGCDASVRVRVRARAPPFSDAVPISGPTASRCIPFVHTSISNLYPSFHSLPFLPFLFSFLFPFSFSFSFRFGKFLGTSVD